MLANAVAPPATARCWILPWGAGGGVEFFTVRRGRGIDGPVCFL